MRLALRGRKAWQQRRLLVLRHLGKVYDGHQSRSCLIQLLQLLLLLAALYLSFQSRDASKMARVVLHERHHARLGILNIIVELLGGTFLYRYGTVQTSRAVRR